LGLKNRTPNILPLKTRQGGGLSDDRSRQWFLHRQPSPPRCTATVSPPLNAKLRRTRFANSDISPLRHYCRNPRCRSKLKEPVSNPHKAFCCKGCDVSFYRHRCRICEQPIEQPKGGGRRATCNRAKCKGAWRADFGFGHYTTPNRAESIQERPVNKGPKVAVNDDQARPWRVVAAGKPVSANQYHCAIVGTADAVAAADRANAVHWRGLSSAPTITISAKIVTTWAPATTSVSDPEDLSIPAFLCRARATP
jgi:hypothetical protein